MQYFIGIDIGGTFTDMALSDKNGLTRYYKVPTTPGDLTTGILDCLNEAAEDLGLSVRELLGNTAHFAHATTHTVNAFIQRKGVKTGLITTRGFSDTILIMRCMGRTAGIIGEKVTHYSISDKPIPVVPKTLIEEVTERIDYKGDVVVPLNEAEVRRSARRLAASGAKAIGISFLWSFKNPAHEKLARRIISKVAPDLYVSISSELCPVLGEYERTSTVAINSSLAPILSAYVRRLQRQLSDLGLKRPIYIMQSTPGVFNAKEAPKYAVKTLKSGFAGGVLGSVYLGGLQGHKDIITTDMGGTSFETCLVKDGLPAIENTPVVDQYHLATPMIDVRFIGSGGGSVGRVKSGLIKVGPDSMGADPGPACYSKGGKEPTVTDADVVLGIINPKYFLGGKMRISKEKASDAIQRKIADVLGVELVEAASGIKRVVDSQMADLVREVTIESGYDSRDFMLYAYGSAGPTHCHGYGRDLSVRGIVIPSLAPAHSAFGIVSSDIYCDFQQSDPMRAPSAEVRFSDFISAKKLDSNFRKLERKALASLLAQNVPRKQISLVRSASMKYSLQVFEVEVGVPPGPIENDQVDKLLSDFERIYEDLYGKGVIFRSAGIEVLTLRVVGIGKMVRPKLKESKLESPDSSFAKKEKRDVFFSESGGFVSTQTYHGQRLKPGNEITGPAIIEYPATTVVISPNQRALIDKYSNTQLLAMN